ncbi:MlaD family protein [Rhodanobacter sp. KK11]|uniref:PqiB family protein n=1 Tax=Rhodanobacter sp. KK11 TaxID=3083255 RepID=UPI002965ECD4|nr:MlaD family protein [Rhodanobacter sp. KK11]MDW2980821.1 MlaD family protein [Rhodanobacter sp. KK11]
MTDDNPIEPAPPGNGELPRPVVRRRRVNASLIWLVPALAALVGLSLVINNWLQAGPQITISFQSAEGLDAGKTPVKYKNVVIGRVNKIRLSSDRSHVLVSVALEKSAAGFATRDTRFWVVRPRIGLGGVSGIDTLLSGAFIGADVGDSTEPEDEFKGLELPPAVNHGAPGRSFILHSDDLGSLDIGSPVYYRRIQVGRVASYELDKDGKGVSLHIFVDGPNDKFVTRSSRFWNASGVDVSLGANGLKVNTQSLATVLAGGVVFQDPPGPHDSTPAAEDASYKLFNDQATAMAPPDGEPHYIRMRFEQSVRGLAVDAPVEFLGINIGKVVSVRLDYDERTQRFPVLVGAVIYPQRLGAAYDKLEALARAHGENADLPQLMGRLVEHGLRAQARTGNLLTGQLYVALDFIPKTPKVAFDPAAKPLTVPTVPGSFDKLQEQMAGIVDKLAKVPFDSIGQNLDRSLAGLDRTLKQVNGQTLPAVRDTLHGVRQTMGTANEALAGDSPLQQNLGATLEQLQRMARSLRVLTDYLGGHPEALIRGRRPDAKPADATPVTAPAAVPPAQGSKP